MSAIRSKLISSGNINYHSDAFRRILEDHLAILRSEEASIRQDIAPIKAHQCEGDFYKVLKMLAIPQHLWWITMRVNGYSSPLLYNGTRTSIKIPNEDYMNELLTRFQQRTTIL